ncbi:hypothetical protein J6T93_06625 [bacterium]|nr:hypothetical protein [bacterium]
MKETFAAAANELRNFARERNITAEFYFHRGISKLVRFANSGVSSNTNEDTFSLDVDVTKGRAKGSFSTTTSPNDIDGMKIALLRAAEIADYAVPVSFDRKVPILPERLPDDSNFDQRIENMTTADALDLVGAATDDLLSEGLSLAGMVSSGAIYEAKANTLNNNLLYHAGTDANMELVITNDKEKWEVQSSQSAVKFGQFAPEELRNEFALLLEQYKNRERMSVPVGEYEVVFGRDAIANLINYFGWIGYNGRSLRHDMSFLKEEDLGKQVFSPLLTVVDDPSFSDTFPYAFDMNGIERQAFPLIKEGVFQSFFWNKETCEEFGGEPTGHDVPSLSIAIGSGNTPINTLSDLLDAPREKDILYIPYLHYMGIVNAAKGIVTGSTRFGALYLKKDGSIAVPYNMRFTASLRELFTNIKWISQRRAALNLSSLYGRRSPEAMLTPRFTCIEKVPITLSNTSF